MGRGRGHSVFQCFDRIDVVSLRERKDRRRDLTSALRAAGLTDFSKLSFFDAYQISGSGMFRSVGSHGCYLSHIAILADAAMKKQSVLILQDDCEFRPGAGQYEVPECDVFYGSHAEDSDVIIGAHCMGFSVRAAEAATRYLLSLLDPATPPEPTAARSPDFNPAIRPPIDGALVWFRREHPDMKTHFALLADQRATRSDVTPGKLDRIPVFRETMEFARRLRRLKGAPAAPPPAAAARPQKVAGARR